MEERTLEAVFKCSICAETAAIVKLISGSSSHPDALKSSAGTVVIDGFIGQVREVVGDKQAGPVCVALLEENPEKLFDVERLWAPFYCPKCRRPYCIKHWEVEVRYDDESPGFYDCSLGTCPMGHRRKVDD